MIITYQLPNQWNWRLFLSISNEDQNVFDILDHLKLKENCYFNIQKSNVNEHIKLPCFIGDSENLIGVICLTQFSFDPKHVMICVHQLIHAMILISEVSGCKIKYQTSQCWAYFVGYMTQLILEVLKDEVEEKNEPLAK